MTDAGMSAIPPVALHPEVAAVTDRVIARSRPTRERYLALIDAARDKGAERPNL